MHTLPSSNMTRTEMRPSWDEYFMSFARLARHRSSCLRRHVGAVAVTEHRVVATGYNGTPHGIPNCDEGGCARCAGDSTTGENLGICLCEHGESNVIIQAARHGTVLKGATIYTTHQPCLICTRLLVGVGIVRVVYENEYPSEVAAALALAAGMPIERLSPYVE